MITENHKKKLDDTLEFQEQLNIETNGKDWQSGINNKDKEINWLRCIHMEIAELIDSTPWKHWKDVSKESDIDNIHIELVDIWHFLASYLILREGYEDQMVFVDLDYEPEVHFDYKKVVAAAEDLSLVILLTQYRGESNFEPALIKFFNLCKLSGLSFNTLYTLYFGKNALNKLRQDNGYADRNYKKTWNGKEDNVYMMGYCKELEKNGTMEPMKIFEETYIHLEKIYKSL